MKRIWLCVLLIASMAALVFAQGEKRRVAAPEKTTISGTLGIAKGSIALKSGSDTYYVKGLGRFVGFIDGLKEGAQVTVEGYAFAIPRTNEGKVFRVTKLTLNGKDYDLDSGGPAGNSRGFAPQGNFSPPQGRQLPQWNKFDNRRPRGGR
jgi:hypothetical protein